MGEEYDDIQFKVARLLADLDGCESGDLIMGIVNWADHSQDGHGYAMSDETERFLRMAIDAEIQSHKEWLSGEGKASGIYEPEDVEKALAAITEYEKWRTEKLQLDKWLGTR